MKKGFSLIELLIVITIIAALVGAALPNFLGARHRARDSKKKAELVQLKNALRLYYGDYQKYPTNSANEAVINGCGTLGTSACPATGPFQAGTVGSETVYMKRLPTYYNYTSTGGDSFLLKATMENLSDNDIGPSQARCGFPTPTPAEFHVCED